MDETRYDAIASFLPVQLLERRAICSPADECTGGDVRAVYVAVTTGGYACYVGQASRAPDTRGAAARRLRAHQSEPSKLAEWAGYWVFPFAPSTSKAKLDACERVVARSLGLPVRNQRWRRLQAEIYSAP